MAATAGRKTSTEAASALPYGAVVRQITPDHIGRWIALGWQDYRESGGVSFLYGLLIITIGAGLTVGLYLAGLEQMILSFFAGFLLIGPLLTVGMYDVSRDLEGGDKPSLVSALTAWRANPRNLLGMGMALAVILVVWIRLTVVIFAVVFPDADMTLRLFVEQGLFTTEGRTVLAIATVIGGGFALMVYVCCVISLPMMLDAHSDIVGSVVLSVAAFFRNPFPMLLWSVLIVVLAILGMLTFYIGLAVVIPVIGHSSWHAYRDIIGPADETAEG